ncbi:MAG: hypothetical protein KDE03_15975 [Rhodobacteraceae bacterium]|nr:hypothetical protein [Paracoccaceae bacterium]
MDALTGYSGFVGTNLLAQHEFAARYNSANLPEIAGQSFSTLVVSSAPAAMWQANTAPEADRAGLLAQLGHLEKARADRAVLISTIAVYHDPSTRPDEHGGGYETETAYGAHRRTFEEGFAAAFPHHLIVRLPALYGLGLKKNFLFDLMNPVPTFLKPEVWDGLRPGLAPDEGALLDRAFARAPDTGLWVFDRTQFGAGDAGRRIAGILSRAGISTRAFTNADSRYQFYGLARLWSDIERAFEYGLSALNCATAPVSAAEVHQAVLGETMEYRSAPIVMQDMRSAHSRHWGREDGYLAGRDEVLADTVQFMKGRAG